MSASCPLYPQKRTYKIALKDLKDRAVSTSRHAPRSWVRRPNKYHGIFASTVSSPLLIHLFSTGTSSTSAPAGAGQSKSSSLAGPSTELGLPNVRVGVTISVL